MSRRQKQPLRQLSEEEHQWLRRVARSISEPSGHVVRAKQLLVVAAGASYTEAARATGRKSNDAVAQLVARFNREGFKAVESKKGAAHHPFTERRNANEFCGKRAAHRIRQRMERQTGL
ncbi:MAG: helix-turn-helix domain-containing protein [Pyrinomonadaceae bacterium]